MKFLSNDMGDHRHQIFVKCQGGITGVKFWSNDKGGLQASNFAHMVRGDYRDQILVTHRHEIFVK